MDGTSVRGTTSPTGSDVITSGSGSARSAQSRTGAGATRPGWGATWRRSRAGRGGRTAPRRGRSREPLAAGGPPERDGEPLDGDVRARERVMLGLRLDEP